MVALGYWLFVVVVVVCWLLAAAFYLLVAHSSRRQQPTEISPGSREGSHQTHITGHLPSSLPASSSSRSPSSRSPSSQGTPVVKEEANKHNSKEVVSKEAGKVFLLAEHFSQYVNTHWAAHTSFINFRCRIGRNLSSEKLGGGGQENLRRNPTILRSLCYGSSQRMQ